MDSIIKQLKKYFGRVNHIYFTEPTEQKDTSCDDHIKNCENLNCIDDMVFQIAVRSFSNIDRKIYFDIDLKKKKVTPDDVTLTGIEASLKGDEVLDGGISSKDNASVSDEDGSSRCTSKTQSVNDDQLVEDFAVLDINNSNDDSEYKHEESDSDSDDIISGWNVTDIEKRTYGIPINNKYQQNMFLTNVNIQRIMELGSMVTKGHNFSKNDQKRKNLRQIHRNDVLAHAVRFAHAKILTGEADIRIFGTKDPKLEDAKDYKLQISDNLSKGWGRRCRNMEGGTYGRKYITEYKDDINELFEEGNKEISHSKMNPAMLREFLAKKYPNTYSLPGETEIKQQINAFVQNGNGDQEQDW